MPPVWVTDEHDMIEETIKVIVATKDGKFSSPVQTVVSYGCFDSVQAIAERIAKEAWGNRTEILSVSWCYV